MKIENTEVYGFRRALRGMRHPMSSYDKSDTVFFEGQSNEATLDYNKMSKEKNITVAERPLIGPEDLSLMKKLTKAGPEHAKFLRQIEIWTDITIPRYIWQELDTYKVGTVRMSCSTRPSELKKKKTYTQEMFEDNIVSSNTLIELNYLARSHQQKEVAIYQAKEYEGTDILRLIKKLLPEGYLQMATYSMNYQTAINMFFQRKNHWLNEWKTICNWIQDLPYMKELITE